MLVKILMHLDVLLAVPTWGENSAIMPESELVFLVVIPTAVICTANGCLGFLELLPTQGNEATLYIKYAQNSTLFKPRKK